MKMSDHVKFELSEKPSATDREYEADGLESFIRSSSTTVEHHWSFTHSFKWKTSMLPRRSCRRGKAAEGNPQRNPDPKEEVIRRWLRGKRQTTWLQNTKADDDVVSADEGNGCDIISIIDRTHAERAAEEDEGKVLETIDGGVDESDEDCGSVTSIASGPSLLHEASPRKRRPSRGLCSACQTLRQKAKKMKAPIKNKLLDNDPKSLTCDHWVLIKNCRPRKLPNARGKLLIRVQLLEKRLKVMKGAKRPGKCVGDGESSGCSRPHAFLQRNLRRQVREPMKEKRRKKNRRKRTRDASQSPRVTKQQRLHGNNRGSRTGVSPTASHGSGPRSEGWSDQEVNDQADTNLTPELTPPTVATETTKPRECPPKKMAPKKIGGFRELLSKLRGNGSMIVRETR